MSEACEDFLRGQGRLAGLLWELSPYEPPASLEASFLAAARTAQQQANARKAAAAATTFEAPAQMAARFSQLAAQVDAAQATRREAVLSQIAAGDAPEAVLGAPVQPATADWLRQRAAAAKPTKPRRKPVLWGFSWFDLRLAALATVLAAVATQWVQQHLPTSVELALLEAFQREATPLADAQPDQTQNQVGAAPPAAPAMARGASPQAASPARSATENRTEPPSAEALQAGSAIPEETPAIAAMPEKKSAVALESRHERAMNDTAEEPARPTPRLVQAAPKAMAAPTDPPPTPHPVAETGAPVAQMERATADAAAKPVTAAAPPPPAAAPAAAARPVWSSPAPAPTAPSRVAPAPARQAGDAPPEQPSAELLEYQRSRAISINASLADEPATIAARLPERPAGRVWVVYQSEPQQAELAAWLEALRQAIPESRRPERFELRREGPQRDLQGKPITIRIVPPPREAPTR